MQIWILQFLINKDTVGFPWRNIDCALIIWVASIDLICARSCVGTNHEHRATREDRVFAAKHTARAFPWRRGDMVDERARTPEMQPGIRSSPCSTEVCCVLKRGVLYMSYSCCFAIYSYLPSLTTHPLTARSIVPCSNRLVFTECSASVHLVSFQCLLYTSSCFLCLLLLTLSVYLCPYLTE